MFGNNRLFKAIQINPLFSCRVFSYRALRFAVLCFTLLQVLFSPTVLADKVYTWIDEEGNRVYSDSPREGSEEVKLKPPMRMESPTVSTPNTSQPSYSTPNTQNTQQKTASYSAIGWVTPEDGQTFPVGASGNVPIAIKSAPALLPGDQLDIYVNGEKFDTFGQSAGMLKNLPRGELKLKAHILSDGKLVGETGIRTIIVHRSRVR